jgi:hypothetical protein
MFSELFTQNSFYKLHKTLLLLGGLLYTVTFEKTDLLKKSTKCLRIQAL